MLDLRAIKNSLTFPAPLASQSFCYQRTDQFVDFDRNNLNYGSFFPIRLPVVYNDAWTG